MLSCPAGLVSGAAAGCVPGAGDAGGGRWRVLLAARVPGRPLATRVRRSQLLGKRGVTGELRLKWIRFQVPPDLLKDHFRKCVIDILAKAGASMPVQVPGQRT